MMAVSKDSWLFAVQSVSQFREEISGEKRIGIWKLKRARSSPSQPLLGMCSRGASHRFDVCGAAHDKAEERLAVEIGLS